MLTRQTSTPSRKERTGVDRLYKRTGSRKVSFYYQYPDGRNDTLAIAPVGDRKGVLEAEFVAKRRAIEIQQGQVVAGSVAALIKRFRDEVAPTHYRDQSKDGVAMRASTFNKLTKFFGAMAPLSHQTVHGYQYLEARAKSGAPARANKALSMLSTICHYAVRWGLIKSNPFTGMMFNRTEKNVRTVSRGQIVRFYLWSLRQKPGTKLFGCAAMFAYLTGFRAAEVAPLPRRRNHPAGRGSRHQCQAEAR